MPVDKKPRSILALGLRARRNEWFGFNASRYKVALWILAVTVSLLGVAPLVSALKQAGPDIADQDVEDFNSGHVAHPNQLLMTQGFRAGDQGWYLAPGETGRLVYRVMGHAGRRIDIQLWMYSQPNVDTTIVAASDGQPPVVISTDTSYVGSELPLPTSLSTAQSIDLEFRAQNRSPNDVLVLDQLWTDTSLGSAPIAPPWLAYVALGLLGGLVAIPLIGRRKNIPAIAIGVGVVAALATATRMTALFAQRGPLDPDAINYRIYADRFDWWPFSSTGLFSGNFSEREPLFPAIAHAYFQLLGSSDFHLRVVSSTLSIAVVILAVVAAGRLLVSWPARLLVGLMVALSGPLIAESTRGLRLELEMVLVLLLYIALDRPAAKRPLADALVVGLLGAALVLSQTFFLPVFMAAVTVSYLSRYRLGPRTIGLLVIATMIVLGAEVGHRIGLYHVQHDAFWDTAGYARWQANVEHFAYHRPLPHPELFPSSAQYASFGPYFGPHITPTQYFFIVHSPFEFVRDSLVGYREIFDTIGGFVPQLNDLGTVTSRLAPRVDVATRWTVLFGLIGLMTRAWRHPRRLLIPVIVVSSLAADAFLFNRGLVERYRNTWETIPLVLIAGAWLIESAVLIALRRIRVRRDVASFFAWLAINADLALFPISLLLALAQFVIRTDLLVPDAVLLAASVGVLIIRRPAAGTAALVLVVSLSGTRTASAVATLSAIAILVQRRPPAVGLRPLVFALPLGLTIALAGRPQLTSLLLAAEMLSVVVTVALVSASQVTRHRLLVLVALMGPLVGIAYFAEPAALPARLLAPAAVVAAAWLCLSGKREFLTIAFVDLVVVVMADPWFSWIGVLAAVSWLVIRSGFRSKPRWRVVIGATVAGLTLATSGASLAAATPPTESSWRAYLGDTASSIRQQVTVDKAGYDSVWIFGRRASAFSDYPVRVDVNGVAITNDLNSYLPTELMEWVRLPLVSTPRPGSVLDIEITASGKPDLVNRYIEIGGVYAHGAGITSTYWDGSRALSVDLSPDPGIQSGTYLIVLGDESLPHAPSGLPAPFVQGQWHLPAGECLPGECAAPAGATQAASTLQIWRESLRAALENPVHGLGNSQLATVLNSTGAGLGPGLSARDQYIQAAAEWGLTGLAALLLMLGAAIFFASRRGDRLATALLVLVVVSMIGESILLDRAGAAVTWMVIGLCLAPTRAVPLGIDSNNTESGVGRINSDSGD